MRLGDVTLMGAWLAAAVALQPAPMTSGRFKAADAEMKAAEKTGFRVNPQFKADLKKAASGR
jgi:hypothetical protein